MPTDEERREVAESLRNVSGAPEWATTACCIAELIGEYDYPLWGSSKPLFSRLADLIEPEPERTCKMELVKSGPIYRVWRFSCCGYEHSENVTDGGATELPGTRCPKCGAVVEE